MADASSDTARGGGGADAPADGVVGTLPRPLPDVVDPLTDPLEDPMVDPTRGGLPPAPADDAPDVGQGSGDLVDPTGDYDRRAVVDDAGGGSDAGSNEPPIETGIGVNPLGSDVDDPLGNPPMPL